MTLNEMLRGGSAAKMSLDSTQVKSPCCTLECKRAIMYYSILKYRQLDCSRKGNLADGDYNASARATLLRVKPLINDMSPVLSDYMFWSFSSELTRVLLSFLYENHWTEGDVETVSNELVSKIIDVMEK